MKFQLKPKALTPLKVAKSNKPNIKLSINYTGTYINCPSFGIYIFYATIKYKLED